MQKQEKNLPTAFSSINLYTELSSFSKSLSVDEKDNIASFLGKINVILSTFPVENLGFVSSKNIYNSIKYMLFLFENKLSKRKLFLNTTSFIPFIKNKRLTFKINNVFDFLGDITINKVNSENKITSINLNVKNFIYTNVEDKKNDSFIQETFSIQGSRTFNLCDFFSENNKFFPLLNFRQSELEIDIYFENNILCDAAIGIKPMVEFEGYLMDRDVNLEILKTI